MSAVLLYMSAQGQTIFSEDFDGINGPTAGGAGTYTFPAGWLLRNVDNSTPAASVSYVNEAWERREDFNFNVADSAAFSTSWYSPAGASNDWMWTPSFTVQPNTVLKWNAVTYDATYPDGYEVRIMTQSSTPGGPTGGSGAIGNQITNSTSIFSIAAENTTWTARQLSLSAYVGETVWIGFRNNSTDKFLLLVDDVVAEVQVNNDLRVQAGSVSHGEYTIAPSNHLTTTQNIQLKGTIYNSGMSAATNARLACDVILNGTLLTTVQSAATASLASATSEAKTIDYFPTLDGTYDFRFYPMFNETDQVTTNDTLYDTYGIIVTPDQMRRDNANVVGSLGIGAGTIGYLGQTFNFENPVNIESISAFMTRGYTGRELRAAIFSTDGAGVPTTYIAGTDTLIYPDDSARLYTMPLYGGSLSLPAGKYAVVQIEIDSTLALANTDDLFTANTVFVQWAGNGPNFVPVEGFGAAFAKSFVLYPNFDLCVGETGGSLANSTQASCGMSNGSAEVTLDAGYSILWEDSTTNAINAGLPAGIHTYTMTNGTCSFTDSVEISNPNAPVATVQTTTDALCNGDEGSVVIDITDGTAPYTTTWSDGDTGNTLTAPAGTYSATIVDAANCQTVIAAATIAEPALLTSSGSSTDETCTSCDDGTAVVTQVGGTSPYTYLWSNGQITDSISGLTPGTYSVTVTDANGCTTSSSVVVSAFVGVDELADYGIVVYPNPVVDYLAVEAKKGNVTGITLVDASGRMISELSKAGNTFTVDVRQLAKGMYRLVITTTNGTIVSAITKQ